jgi:hypothetical protein
LTAKAESLRSEPAVATLMLRLGAAVNAIRASQRMTLIARKTPGLLGLRDLTWTFLAAAAQLKEAIDSLLKTNLSVIVSNAREGGASEEDLSRLNQILDDGPESLYARVLREARDRITYHWDKKAFVTWQEAQSASSSVVWILGEGQREGDVLHIAAAAALTEAIIPNATYEEVNLRVGEVSHWCGILTMIFQFAIAGYLYRYGAKEMPYHDASLA